MIRFAFRLFVFSVLILALPQAAQAAPGRGTETITPTKTFQGLDVRDALVERAQKALGKAGYYRGDVTGKMDKATAKAIKKYQKRAGLKVDGKISEDLVDGMEAGDRVGVLLQNLDKTRDKSIKDARNALLSQPATRGLLNQDGQTSRADPTRDVSACFEKPTALCLLTEAAESAKAIGKDELRDWAFGEILAIQAKAGLTDDALLSVRQIQDPRLIMVALRDMAEGQARTGNIEEAWAAADIIPDARKKAEALAAITRILTRQNNIDDARKTVTRLTLAIDPIKDPLVKVTFQARIAVLLSRLGDHQAADAALKAAESAAQTEQQGAQAIRHVASAFADMERPDDALGLLSRITGKSDRTPILVSAATAQAKSGEAQKALGTAADIEAVRYRAVVLSRIALSQARAGDHKGASDTLEKAREVTKTIRFPYARDFALSRIAYTFANLPEGDNTRKALLDQAEATTLQIKDNRLRSQFLWVIASERRKDGDLAGAEKTSEQAEKQTRSIKSKLTQVWMFADLSVKELQKDNKDEAWAAFYRALETGSTIDNAWGRARALGRLADTLIILNSPHAGHLYLDEPL